MLIFCKITTQAIAGAESSQEACRDECLRGRFRRAMLRSMKLKPSNNGLSNYILPTSANLLGICFLIFSFAHTTGKSEATLLDDMAGIAIVVFMLATIFSYLSIRIDRENHFENFADVFFFIGILLLAMTSTLMIFKLIV